MRRRILGAAMIGVVLTLLTGRAAAAEATHGTYRGWNSLAMSNGLIEMQVVPSIGGRVIQLRLGDFEYLWVNDQLAGKEPPPSGLDEKGGWLNYGGDKLWPAPQGWDNDEQWPGPPDAVLDGSPHAPTVVASGGHEAAVKLVSQEDKRTGIQFSRVIRVADGSAHVGFESTMKNIDTKPRRWGIWQVTQVNAANGRGQGYNKEVRWYSPASPSSAYPRGYVEMFGLVNNPSFKLDRERKLIVGNYQRLVGKIGVDNTAGWVAVVAGNSGYALIERFTSFPDKKYPEGTSVTCWMNGAGQFVAANKLNEAKDDPVETPHFLESEILSPLVELSPGESYSFHLDWYATKIGGNYPILETTAIGVTREPFSAKLEGGKIKLRGRYGVFTPGTVVVRYLDADGKLRGDVAAAGQSVSPTQPLALDQELPIPPDGAATVALMMKGIDGEEVGELARVKIR